MGFFYDLTTNARRLAPKVRERLLMVAEPAARNGDTEALRGFLHWRKPEPLLVDLTDPIPLRDAARQAADDESKLVRSRAASILLELRDAQGLWAMRHGCGPSLQKEIRPFVLGKLRRIDEEILLRAYAGPCESGAVNLRMQAFGHIAKDRPELAVEIAKQALPNPEVPKAIREAILYNLPDNTFHPKKLEIMLAEGDVGLARALTRRLASSVKDWPLLEKRIRKGGVNPRNYVREVAAQRGGKARVQRLARDLDDDVLLAEVLCALGANSDGDLIRRGLTCSEARGRAEALRIAVKLTYPNAFELALGGLSDAAKEVQFRALNSLVDLGNMAALPAMRALIDETDVYDERYNQYAIGETAACTVERLEAKGG